MQPAVENTNANRIRNRNYRQQRDDALLNYFNQTVNSLRVVQPNPLDVVVTTNNRQFRFPGEKIHYLLQNFQTYRRIYCLRKNTRINTYRRTRAMNIQLRNTFRILQQQTRGNVSNENTRIIQQQCLRILDSLDNLDDNRDNPRASIRVEKSVEKLATCLSRCEAAQTRSVQYALNSLRRLRRQSISYSQRAWKWQNLRNQIIMRRQRRENLFFQQPHQYIDRVSGTVNQYRLSNSLVACVTWIRSVGNNNRVFEEEFYSFLTYDETIYENDQFQQFYQDLVDRLRPADRTQYWRHSQWPLLWQIKNILENRRFQTKVQSRNVVKIIVNVSSHFHMCDICRLFINYVFGTLNGLNHYTTNGISIEMRYSSITPCERPAQFDQNDTMIHNSVIPENMLGVVHKEVNQKLYPRRENLDEFIGSLYQRRLLFFSGQGLWERQE